MEKSMSEEEGAMLTVTAHPILRYAQTYSSREQRDQNQNGFTSPEPTLFLTIAMEPTTFRCLGFNLARV